MLQFSLGKIAIAVVVLGMLVNKRILTSTILLGLASLILYGGVVIPSIFSINETKEKIATEHAKIERRYVMRSVMRKSLASLEQTKNQLRQMSSIALIEGGELEFISALETAAADHHVALGIDLQTVNQKDLSLWEKDIPLRLEIQGDFLDTVRFLDAVERLPYYYIVDTIISRSESGAAGPGSTGTPFTRTELTGTVYWLSTDAPDFVLPAVTKE